MQKPNFPNEVFRVVLSSGAVGESPKASITAIPAKYNQASVATASRRRIAIEKLGKSEIIAESTTMMILRTWVANREHIPEVIQKMHHRIQRIVQGKIDNLLKLQSSIVIDPIITEKVYEDD